MFIGFLHQLKESGVPVSIREYLDFLSGLDKGVTNLNTDSFYHFAGNHHELNHRIGFCWRCSIPSCYEKKNTTPLRLC